MRGRLAGRLWRGVALAGLGLAMGGCARLVGGSPATLTPFPFVTASPRPVATPRPPTPASPVPPTASPPPPQPTLRGSPLAPTSGPEAPPAQASPTVPGVEGDCPVAPQGGFGTIFEDDPGLPPALGCPASPSAEEDPQAWVVDSRWQPFERGEMLWMAAVGWDPSPVVYAIFEDGTYQRLDDTFNPEADPLDGPEVPPPGLFEPVGSLGKAWREGPGVSARLGWASAPESEDFTWTQVFTNGEMVVVVPVGRTYVFKRGSPNTWQTYDVTY